MNQAKPANGVVSSIASSAWDGAERFNCITLYRGRNLAIRKRINMKALWKDFILTDRVHNAITEYPRIAVEHLPLTEFLDLTR